MDADIEGAEVPASPLPSPRRHLAPSMHVYERDKRDHPLQGRSRFFWRIATPQKWIHADPATRGRVPLITESRRPISRENGTLRGVTPSPTLASLLQSFLAGLP